MKSQRLRKIPPKGTIICIPLPKGGFAYAMSVSAMYLWLYNFVTNRPAFLPQMLGRERRLQYISCYDDAIGVDSFDVGVISLSPEDLIRPKRFRRIPEEAMRNHPTPTPYEAWDPALPQVEGNFFFITEAELPQYQEFLMFSPKQLLDYLETNRHRLEIVEVETSQAITPRAVEQNAGFDPISTFEIWLSELEKMTVSDLQDIAEEIDVELEEKEAGEVVGTGQTVGEDQHNIAVQNAPGKNKQALACIRRVLKRLKANPETTDIWEQQADSDEHIEHPLISPTGN